MMPAPLEHVDQPPGARVADAQAPLQQRDRRGLRGDDDLDRAVEQRVLVGVELAVLAVGAVGEDLRRVEEGRVDLLLALHARLLDDERDLLLGHVGALDALQPRGAERLVEHVARAEQALGPVLVEDHARVGLRGDGEGDPRGDVRLDHPGDDVDRGPLGREHEVDADGARLLREPDDRVLDVLGADHHQVGELVDHDEQVGKLRLAALAEGAVGLRQAARAHLREPLVAALHLGDDVEQDGARLLGARDDRRQQVRDRLVVVELDPLGVDQDHAHLVGARAQEDRGEDRVDAARLARAGRAGDQQVRHAREVGVDGLAVDALAEPDRERARRGRDVAEDVAEGDEVRAQVRHLDPDRLLAGDRREDADLGRRERVGEVVAQLGDLADLDPGGELELVAGDARAGDRPDDGRLDAEVRQAEQQRLGDAPVRLAARARRRVGAAQHRAVGEPVVGRPLVGGEERLLARRPRRRDGDEARRERRAGGSETRSG